MINNPKDPKMAQTQILCFSLSCLRRSSRWERPVQWTGAGAFFYANSIIQLSTKEIHHEKLG